MHIFILMCSVFATVGVMVAEAGRLTESERVALWHANNNTWPPTWQPESDGMKRLLEKREILIQKNQGSQERWENYLQFTQQRLVPRFTEMGFEKVKMPEEVFVKLNKKTLDAVKNFDAIRNERKPDVIYYDEGKEVKFLDIGDLAWESINALKGMHEDWVGGIELKPTSSYGIRLYQNGSSLVMHYDKVHTHVISSIMHIAHEYDNDDEPWPIQIEDHDGNLHSVELAAGEMLFYESAKCLHGRMTKFKGKYYANIFVHYQPVDRNIWSWQHEDIVNSVPPHWNDGTVRDDSFKGSRWAGASITVDDRCTEDAPDRIDYRTKKVEHYTEKNRVYLPITPPPSEEELEALRTAESRDQRSFFSRTLSRGVFGAEL